jgi:chromosome segregation ATPase
MSDCDNCADHRANSLLIRQHEERLDELNRRLDEAMKEIATLRENARGSMEQLKTLFYAVERIEAMLKDYTVEMRTALTAISTSLTSELKTIHAEIDEIKARDGSKWDKIVNAIINWMVPAALVGIFIYISRGGAK